VEGDCIWRSQCSVAILGQLRLSGGIYRRAHRDLVSARVRPVHDLECRRCDRIDREGWTTRSRDDKLWLCESARKTGKDLDYISNNLDLS